MGKRLQNIFIDIKLTANRVLHYKQRITSNFQSAKNKWKMVNISNASTKTISETEHCHSMGKVSLVVS